MTSTPRPGQLKAQAALRLELKRLGVEAETLARMDRLVIDFWQNSDAHKLLQDAASVFNYKALLVRRLNIVLASARIVASLAVVEERPEAPSSSILVVLFTHQRTGSYGEILRFPISSSQDFVYATTPALSFSLDSVDFGRHLEQLSSPWASCFMDLLLLELKSTVLPTRRRICNRHLRYLSDKHGVLPPSLLIYNVEMDSRFPVTYGGFADIYKGRLHSSPVCLKVLRYCTSATAIERKRLFKRLRREALAWTRLDHPNIFPFLGIAAELFQPSFCLVLPWMSNGNIMSFLERNTTFDRLKAIIEIAQAMKYLHDFDPPVIHADIRGANVLINDDLRCCLTDFGLASVGETQTSSAAFYGTSRWTAPEYLQPGSQAKPSRDIYAFGCTILEIYTGKRPFYYYEHGHIVLREVVAGKRPRRDDFQPDFLWSLIEACWCQAPEERPSAEDVLSILLPVASNTDPDSLSQTSLENRSTDVVSISQTEHAVSQGSHAFEPEPSPLPPAHKLAKRLRRKLKCCGTDIVMPYSELDDIIILVMGPIGSGKSTFINTALGNVVMEVGTGLVSCTAEPCHTVLSDRVGSRRIVLLDTPGFAHTWDHDVEILRGVRVWLAHYYGQDRQVTAVIFLYDISQPRISIPMRRCLQLFRIIFSEHTIRRVILTSSKWDLVDRSMGLAREEQVKKFGEGAGRTARFDGTNESARTLVKAIMKCPGLTVDDVEVRRSAKLPETHTSYTISMDQGWASPGSPDGQKLDKGSQVRPDGTPGEGRATSAPTSFLHLN